MGLPSGLAGQLGIKTETTYGTPAVPVDRFYEYTEETLKLEIGRIKSAAVRSGTRVQRSDRWAPGARSVGGDVSIEVVNKSLGLWLSHAIGTGVTTQPDAGSNPTVYLHTFTPSDLPTSFTAQAGRPDVGGTVRPFTYHGCRVSEWELSVEADAEDPPTFKFTVIGEDEDTSTGLAAASYPAGLTLLTWVNATLTLAGSAYPVKSVSLTGNNGLADDRRFLGSQLRSQPLEAAMREYTGELESEFVDFTAYNRFVNGTEAALVLLFEGATISTTYKYQLKVTANVRFDGETPTVSNRDELLEQPLPFECVGNTSATALTVEYQTVDTAP